MTIETWKFVNTFAPWLAAIGTIFAASVALYLGISGRREKIKVSMNKYLYFVQGEPNEGERPSTIAISAINIGHTDTVVTSVGWETGSVRKNHYVQWTGGGPYFPGLNNSELPKRLRPGEEAKFYFNPETYFDNADQLFRGWFARKFPKLYVKSFVIVIYTAKGSQFRTMPSQEICKLFVDKIEELRDPDA